jgi:probable HAF family extracellular repeat protein
VAISGKTVVAGAPRWPAYDGPGAAYVFVEPESGWKSTSKFNAKLTASDGAVNDYLGFFVAISGDTAVFGAYGATIGSNSQQGAAYVFGGSHLSTTQATPVRLAALEQEQDKKKEHARYKLVDLGTFGGPRSYLNFGAEVLDNRGTVAGYADTPTPDPFPSSCFNPDCFVSHAFQWEDGVVTDLGTLAPGWSSQSTWISGNGHISGFSQNGEIDPLLGIPEFRGVLWKDAQIINLGTLGGGYQSLAAAVNNPGQVAGMSLNTIPDPFCQFAPGLCTTQTRAFLWQDGVMKDLGTLGGPDAFAFLINDSGQVAGISYINSIPLSNGLPQEDPFLWEPPSPGFPNGKMIDLGNLGGPTCLTWSLNNGGQVVGQMDLVDISKGAVFHPFLWDGKSLKDLGSLPGPDGFFGNAFWINDSGEVVGWADNNIVDFPILWKDGATKILGVVAGDTCAHASYINSKGQIVGESGPCPVGPAHAFLWEDGGSIIDLNTLVPYGSGVHLTSAVTINDRGEIAAQGLLPNGDQHAFALIPCDENHPKLEGCDNSLIAATAGAPQPNPAGREIANRAPLPPRTWQPSRFNAWQRRRFNIPGRGIGPRN